MFKHHLVLFCITLESRKWPLVSFKFGKAKNHGDSKFASFDSDSSKEMLQAYDESPGYSRCGPGCANDDNSDKNTSIAKTSASIKFIKFIMLIMFTLGAATPQIPGGKTR